MICQSKILPDYQELYFKESFNNLYESLSGKWFTVPIGTDYNSKKPPFLSIKKSFRLNNKPIGSILSTENILEMHETDADAILADYFFIPNENHLKKIITRINKPVIATTGIGIWQLAKLPVHVKKIESLGVSSVVCGSLIPLNTLYKICKGSSIPVIATAGCNIKEIQSKINAGASAVVLKGKKISKTLVETMNLSNPGIPIIAEGGKSEVLMRKSIESGVDAIIYKPYIPFEKNQEDY